MKVVGAGLINKAKRRHGDLDGPLSAWLKIAEEQSWTSLKDLRNTFPHTDSIEGKYVFNIKGNSYRLTATINFRSQLLVNRAHHDSCRVRQRRMEVSAATVDYGRLVSDVQPQVVHDEALNEKFIGHLKSLDARWDELSKNEMKLHELLVLIIQDFEKRTYKIRSATPLEVIEELMAANNLRNKDLVGIFATESVVSEVLSGKRQLTVEHIKRLAQRFDVSPAVFFA